MTAGDEPRRFGRPARPLFPAGEEARGPRRGSRAYALSRGGS